MSAGRPARSTSSDFRCLTIEILKGRCHYFHMYISVLPSCSFTHCSHHLLPIRQRVLLCLRCSIRWSIYRICKKDTFNDPLSVCRISMWITNILTEMAVYSCHPATHRDTIPDYLREIHHLFDTQYGENYSLDELENTYSVSKYRICREFSKYYGASPVQYLNHKRIEEAKNCF